jgi:gliding motility-associated-like protein
VIQNPDSSAIFNLPGGAYQVSISDAQGCATIDTFMLDSVNVMSFADTTLTSPSCAGLTDGLISIGVQGGQPPYVSFNWMPTQTNTSTVSNLGAGTYAVTVTDNQGCTLVGSFDLEEPPAITATFSGISTVSCFGVCDGEVTAEVSYASTPPTSGDFTFLWDDGNTDSLRTDICAGVHAVTITDGNNCFAIDSVDIPTPPEVSGAATTTPASCFGEDDGTATIAGAGGNGAPYTYLWSDPNGTTTPTVGGLVAGEYTVTVTDANGCTGVVDSVFVTQPDEIGITQNLPGSADPNCFGGTDGSLAIDVAGGNVGVFTYEWSDGANIVGNTEDLEDLAAGAYSVTVTDPNGCTGILENLILQDPPPVLGNYLDWEPLLCNGDETTLVIDTIYGGSGGPYQYSLDFGAVLDPDFPATLDGGEHYITYFDARNCEYTDTIFVREPEAITVIFDPMTLEIELGDSVQLRPIITGALVDTFYWAPADLLLNPFSLNPQAYTFETETYTLTVVDSNGCVGTGMILVNVDPNRNVFVPNIFKPENATGLNDHFNVYVGRGVENISFMRVYDRWGELLYERNNFFPDNNNLAEGWDGRYNGKLVNPGVYIYIVEVKFLDGRVLLYRGDVTVIR